MSAAAWQVFFGLPLALGSVVLGAEDLRTGYLPDRWVLLLGCCGLLVPAASHAVFGYAGDSVWMDPLWLYALAGAAVGGGVLFFLRVASGGGLGGGDVVAAHVDAHKGAGCADNGHEQ